jgi:hypothetical protein
MILPKFQPEIVNTCRECELIALRTWRVLASVRSGAHRLDRTPILRSTLPIYFSVPNTGVELWPDILEKLQKILLRK